MDACIAIDGEDLMEFIHRRFCAEYPAIGQLSVPEFSRCSLGDYGVDSLSIVSLLVEIKRALGIELPDGFVGSNDVLCPARWGNVISQVIHGYELKG